MLYEDDVVIAVMNYLTAQGWQIESYALATQHGDDIVAERAGTRLVLEAKGQGSSKPHTSNYGSGFSRGQVSKHVANAVFRALRVISAGQSEAAVAFPSTPNHRHEISQVWPALRSTGMAVYWVEPDASVWRQA